MLAHVRCSNKVPLLEEVQGRQLQGNIASWPASTVTDKPAAIRDGTVHLTLALYDT